MRAYEFIREADDISVPQPGPSSGKAAQLNPDTNVNQQNLTLKQIHKSIQGIPYHKDVIRDYDKKDFSWDVTPKAVEYAKFLKNNPESLKNLPPIVAILSQYISDNIRGSVAANLAEWIDGNIQVLGQGYSREVKNKNSDDLQVEL